MRKHTGAQRLTWDPALQFPFESGWSLFRKVMILNNLDEFELGDLISRPQMPRTKSRLRNCADSSWIDFNRFSELLEVPASELRNGFWDQLGINVLGGDRSTSRVCSDCWHLHQYHCLFFDLTWVVRCPWHRFEIRRPNTLGKPATFAEVLRSDLDKVSFDKLLSITRMGSEERHRVIGHVVEYLEWWRAIQAKVPHADVLLRRLVSTGELSEQGRLELRWQAGFAQEQAPLRYRSWILQNTPSIACRSLHVTDAGRIPGQTEDRTTIHDDTGKCYRAIRRHIYRTYVRRHRGCLSKLAKLDQDERLSLARSGVCVTCLAYVVWRMAAESLMIMKGLHHPRTTNYEMHLSEPWPHSPSDDAARLSFTYMQFFGLWAAMTDQLSRGGLKVSMQDTVATLQVVFARDESRPFDSPLRVVHCLYPDPAALALRAGRPCTRPWNLLSSEQQCVLRTSQWLNTLRPTERSLFEIYVETNTTKSAAGWIQGFLGKTH
ncbi:hypothetical protein [Massilia timonae]|uniref:hypothetical protein n=1 Tax=Massilia timonae TaxID=47229 RepID=UPI0028D8AA7B|nr:hypothetical protein [Massilia timonae]